MSITSGWVHGMGGVGFGYSLFRGKIGCELRTMKQFGKAHITAVCLILTAGLVTSCGVRGSLEYPPEAKTAQQSNASASSGQGKAAGAAPKPHKSFILDKLLQ